MERGTAADLAARWLRAATRIDASARPAYLVTEMSAHDPGDVAEALDVVCASAEQADARARETLVALVDAVAHPQAAWIVESLREEARSRSLLALGRLLRRKKARGPGDPGDDERAAVPDYGAGRPLTLGERKALARRPSRVAFDKLLRDPDPSVMRNLLANPRIVEDDVVRVSARRPGRPAVLCQIAQSPRWVHRPRVRMAVVLNPDTPTEVAVPLVSLLVRHELRLVLRTTDVPAVVRAAARELLARRPPPRTAKSSEPPVQ